MGVLSDMYQFKDYLIGNDKKILSTGEIALWYALKLFEDENLNINISGRTLERCTGLSHKGFHKARENLIQKGFIEYTSDSAKNKSGKYKIVHTEMAGNYNNSEKVHTETAGNCNNSEKVHTETAGNYNNSEKVHTEIAGNYNNGEKVHTETAGNCNNSEKVHTETAGNCNNSEIVHTEMAGNCNNSEKVHTETASNDTDFNKLFGVEDDILKTNTTNIFNKTSRIFKRMTKNEAE